MVVGGVPAAHVVHRDFAAPQLGPGRYETLLYTPSPAAPLVFVDLSTATPAFFVTPPDVAAGVVEQWRDRWDRLDT